MSKKSKGEGLNMNKEYSIITEYEKFTDKEFIAEVYELAFGENAINRDFCHGEVVAKIKEEFAEKAEQHD